MRRGLFAGLGDVGDCDEHATGAQRAFRLSKKIALQVIADGNQIPTGRLKFVLMLFEVGDARIHFKCQFLA